MPTPKKSKSQKIKNNKKKKSEEKIKQRQLIAKRTDEYLRRQQYLLKNNFSDYVNEKLGLGNNFIHTALSGYCTQKDVLILNQPPLEKEDPRLTNCPDKIKEIIFTQPWDWEALNFSKLVSVLNTCYDLKNLKNTDIHILENMISFFKSTPSQKSNSSIKEEKKSENEIISMNNLNNIGGYFSACELKNIIDLIFFDPSNTFNSKLLIINSDSHTLFIIKEKDQLILCDNTNIIGPVYFSADKTESLSEIILQSTHQHPSGYFALRTLQTNFSPEKKPSEFHSALPAKLFGALHNPAIFSNARNETALKYAIISGNIYSVINLIEHGATIKKENYELFFNLAHHLDMKNCVLQSLLYCAARDADKESFLFALSQNADINDNQIYKTRPVHFFTKTINLNWLEFLANTFKINFDLKDSASLSPLHLVIDFTPSKHFKRSEKLNIEHNQYQLLKWILAKKANTESKNQEGLTPLHYAILKHNGIMVEKLLEYKANVNAKDNNSSTSLHFAANENQLIIAKCLIQYHADLFAVDHHLKTPLDLAKSNEMQKLLLDQMLISAAKHNKCQLVNSILLDRANVNVQDFTNGMSPLHYAAQNNNIVLANLLLKQGADFTLKSDSEDVPIEYAMQSEIRLFLSTEILKLRLLKYRDHQQTLAENNCSFFKTCWGPSVPKTVRAADAFVTVLDKKHDIQLLTPFAKLFKQNQELKEFHQEFLQIHKLI